jgi:hypothetical protein
MCVAAINKVSSFFGDAVLHEMKVINLVSCGEMVIDADFRYNPMQYISGFSKYIIKCDCI